eukprot:GDKI01009677.1.p1 GENE.GDKI01009677.1~~GDKI01009677.1.p1  ORF type:complete len:723 (-),score=240.73 GDKI01009677.1:1332-3500(-)
MSDNQEPMSVVTRGLCYSVPDPKTKGKSIQIIKNVDVCVKPGQLLAIMGPSGGGKTTMLNLLAQRISGGDRSGEILYNGRPAKEVNMKKISNYVMQHDQLLEFLTVEETLLFNAALKLKHLGKKERYERVERIMAELGLTVCRNVAIGGQFKKGISGGQKKRVSIAIELLDNPSLLFLDEPTSGLDSSLAFDVLKILVDMAKAGRTVICTMHQPRSQVFALFDQLLLLSRGEVVYQGPAAEAEHHFKSMSYACPKHFNPADFMLDLLSTKANGQDGSEQSAGDGIEASGSETGNNMAEAEQSSVGELLLEDVVQLVLEDIDDGSSHIVFMPPNVSATPPAVQGDAVAMHGGPEQEQPDLRPLPELRRFHKSGLKFEEGGRFFITQEEIDDLPVRFKESTHYQNIIGAIEQQLVHHGTNSSKAMTRNKSGLVGGAGWDCHVYDFVYEFLILSYRVSVNCMRNPLKTVAALCTNIFFALILGGVYFQLPTNNTIDARNLGSACFMISLTFLFSGFFVIPTFPPESTLLNRDLAQGLYSPGSFFLAKSLAEIPFNHVGPSILGTIFYWMVGFRTDAARFFTFLLICQVTVWAAVGFSLCISAITPNVEVALAVGPLFFVVFFLISGFYLSDDAIPAWINWMKYLAFTRYAYLAIMVNMCDGIQVDTLGPDGLPVAGGQVSVLSQFALEGKDLWENIGVLFAVGCGYRLLGFLAVKYTNRRVGLEN